MRTNFEYAFQLLLEIEKGFVNDPKDPGGMTNLGVTKAVWEEWKGQIVDEATMRGLTPEMVAPLYKAKYWNPCRGDELPSGLDICVFDFAVNSGVKRAIKLLQRCVNAEEDGIIGKNTMTAIFALNPEEIIDRYCSERQTFLESLSNFSIYGKGWTRRVAEVKQEAMNLA